MILPICLERGTKARHAGSIIRRFSDPNTFLSSAPAVARVYENIETIYICQMARLAFPQFPRVSSREDEIPELIT